MISAPTTCGSANCGARWTCRSPPSPRPRTRRPGPRSSRGCSTGAAPQIFLRGFDRPNIHLAFAVKDSPRSQILAFAAARKGQSGIVYCATRAKTESLAAALREAGPCGVHYHGGMEADDRRHGRVPLPAGGRADRRGDGRLRHGDRQAGHPLGRPCRPAEIHRGLLPGDRPRRPRRRAGRDADALRRRTTSACAAPRSTRAWRRPSARRPITRGSTRCWAWPRRRRAGGRCCWAISAKRPRPAAIATSATRPPDVFDGTEAVRKALSAMLRTGENFGAGHLIDILTGTRHRQGRASAATTSCRPSASAAT